DKSYLQELKRLRDHEAKNKKVKTFLDTEILACEKTIKYHELLHDKKQVFEKLQPLEKLLELTSREALREDLVQMMLPMQKEIQRLSDEIVKQEMTKAEFKSRLVQCEEMMAVLLFSLSDGNEFEKQTTKPAKVKKESPWLMLCQAETGLDAHESQLPTTTITNYAFDESEEFAKIYIDLPGLEVSDKSKLKPTYSERHFSLLVADVEDRNYKIHFSNLTDAVDGANSKIKLKKGKV
ncbi:HSP20-like chaperone, partial [Trinorchestia longiramus]